MTMMAQNLVRLSNEAQQNQEYNAGRRDQDRETAD